MKSMHKVKQLPASKRLFNIEVPQEELAIIYEEVYSHIQKEAALPGFRKGNAPLDLIRKNYSDYAKKRVLEIAVEDAYRDAMKQAGLLPVGEPAIENVKLPDKGALTFDAAVEIRPGIELKNYKGLKIRKNINKVDTSEVEKALENLRQLGAQYKTVEPRPIKEGDYVVCDMEWLVEGKSIEKRGNALLPVEKNTLTQEIFNGILGSVTGDKKTISVNLDKNFPKQEYVGKTAVLEILINLIQEKELPALDDEFAKDLGIKEGIAVLREKIKERLVFEKDEASRLDMQGQLIEQLAKSYSFELPESLVEGEFKNLKSLNKGGEKPLRLHAEKQVKIFFILEEIAEKEKLFASDEELGQFIDALAERQGQKDKAAFRRKMEHQGRINGLHWQVTEAKVMQFLLDNAKIEEAENGN